MQKLYTLSMGLINYVYKAISCCSISLKAARSLSLSLSLSLWQSVIHSKIVSSCQHKQTNSKQEEAAAAEGEEAGGNMQQPINDSESNCNICPPLPEGSQWKSTKQLPIPS